MKKLLLSFIVFVLVLASLMFFRRGTDVQENAVIDVMVGTNAEYQPFTFVKDGRIVGFDIDVVREVFNRLGKTIKIKDMPFDVLIPELQRGTIAVIAAGMTPNESRRKALLFSDNYFDGDPLVIVSPKERPVKTVKELFGKSVIVNDGYTADSYMSQFKEIVVRRLPNPAAAFLALQSDRAPAFVAARSAVIPFLEQYGEGIFSVIPIDGTQEVYALAISPKQTDLCDEINATLERMKADGVIDQLKKKWRIA